MKKFKRWIYGLGSAVIGGGASAVTSSFTAGLIAPDKFNLTDHIGNLFKLAMVTFAFNGFLTMMAYLSKSPLPDLGDTQIFTKPTDQLTPQQQLTVPQPESKQETK